jgi:hypothetical protein
MCVQSDEEEELVLVGKFGAAAAVTNVEVSSLHKKCVELALLPRTVFGAYRNATARRNYSTDKKQKESAERLFVRIEKAVNHPDSCFLNKKQRNQLTSMCLQHLQPQKQQQDIQTASTVAEAMEAGKLIQVKELKTILRKAGLDVEGLKLTLLQRVHEAKLMHQLKNPRAAETLLTSYNSLQGNVFAEGLPDLSDSAAEEEPAEEALEEEEVEEAVTEEAAAEPEAKKAEEPDATAEDASADPAAKEDAAEPLAEIALPHISNFYTTSTEGNKGRTWDIDAWQAMVESNCPELQLLPTEGDMTWSTEVVMPVLVSNSLPTAYTHEMHQFLAQHFDYGRNLVVIDLLAVKQSHCAFMVLLCDEAERTRVENSKVVADDGSTTRSNAIPTDLLFFDDLLGGMTHYPSDELDQIILEKVSKEWLFAGASIYGASLLHEDYGKRLLGLDLECTWQEKKYNILAGGDVDIQSCTASSALAQAVLVHTAGWPAALDVFKAAGVLSLPDTTAAAEQTEDYVEGRVYYNMTEDRNKFMAYCMAMRVGGFFSGVKGAFDWPGDILDDDKAGKWALDKLSMALFYPLVQNKAVFIENAGLVDVVLGCWKLSDAVVTSDAAKPPAKLVKAAKPPKTLKAMEGSEEHTRLNPEQIEKIVPLMLRNTQVGSSVQLSELHGKDIEGQMDMFTLSAEMLGSARDKGLKRFKDAENQIAYTSVTTAGRCTTVLAVNPQAGKSTAASKDRSGSQVDDHRLRLGEVAHFSTMMMHDKMTKPLVAPMKVASRELNTYLHPISQLPEEFGDSMENVCYATAIVQPGHKAAQLDDGQDTRNTSPFVMLYRVYQADEFQKLVGDKEGFAQADGTFRVVTMIPHTFFVNWYALLPCIRFVVH